MKAVNKKSQHKSSPRVRVIGSGEAFDHDLGNTSYLLSGTGVPTMLFDCGYQIPERLWKAGLHTALDAICFTHLHADHSFGIVPMLVRFAEEGRKAPLTIIGPRGTERFVPKLLDMGYPGFSKRIQFPILYLALDPKTGITFGSVRLTCAPTVHSVLNYTIRIDGTEDQIASFAVSGDGQITPETKKLVSDVDVLFQEIYCDKPGIPVHADLKTVSDWIKKSDVKKIVGAHFSRSRKAVLKQDFKAKSKRPTQWITSRPGLEVSL